MTGVVTLPEPPAPPPEAILRHGQPAGPRDAPYPGADRLSERFRAADLAEFLWARHQLSQSACAPLGVHVHIPFGDSARGDGESGTVGARHRGRGQTYVEALDREVGLVVDHIGACRSVAQVHLGGGSPTLLTDAELAALMGVLRRNFFLVPQADLSIDVDPRTVDARRLAHLRSLGLNRIGLGVQDFDAQVQKAVHREQPFELVRDVVAGARAAGFASIDVDLVYDLPRQTPESLRRTVDRLAQLRPDRIALHAFTSEPAPAHARTTRRGTAAVPPPQQQRVALLADALCALHGHGYDHLGMDHFALPGDALAIARREGHLHWNFRGYGTQPAPDLIGLGVSAMGQVGDCCYQNARALPDYYAALDDNRLPVERGHVLDADDRVRRDIIQALLSRGRVDFADIRARHGVDVPTAYADDIVRLAPLAAQGLVELHGDGIRVTPSGWYVLRAVAMAFDRHRLPA